MKAKQTQPAGYLLERMKINMASISQTPFHKKHWEIYSFFLRYSKLLKICYRLL